jgi:hypothetical protein
MLTATVSGSFHRHITEIEIAVNDLLESGVRVLSPADPRVVDSLEEFLFVASDRVRSVRLVQDRHLESIRASDFLWLVTPDGYVGQSASMELGFALAASIPIFSSSLPFDLTLRQYVQKVPNLRSVIKAAAALERPDKRRDHFLIDPHASIEVAHRDLEDIQRLLAKPPRDIDAATEAEIQLRRSQLALMVGDMAGVFP